MLETVTKPPKTSEPSVVAPVIITLRALDPTLCTRQLLPSAVRRYCDERIGDSVTELVPLPAEPVKVPDDSVKVVAFVMMTSKNPPKPSDAVKIGIVCPVPVHRRSPPSTSLPTALLLP